jgi:hypothetical protein
MPSDRSNTLSPAQRRLMANAALDPERRLVRPPDMTSAAFGRSVQALASRDLVHAIEQKDQAASVRLSASQRDYVLTLVGLAMIASPPFSEPGCDAALPAIRPNGGPPLTDLTGAGGSSDAPRQSRHDQIVAMLSRPEGASVPAIMAVTGWLPHTTRAALSGLRKKGHCLDRTQADGEAAIYRIVASQWAA